MTKRIVVVGGGPAGVWAAIEAKRHDPSAAVLLLTEEPCEPYEKPPLSKAVLLGKARPEDALIAGPGGLAAHNVAIELNVRCEAIDRPKRNIVTTNGMRPYDRLVIATGSLVRELALLPIGTHRVHYLRSAADAHALRTVLSGCRRLAVIGGGLIGLEVAASAAEMGTQVVVLEAENRILRRVCDVGTSDQIFATHRQHGVEIRLSSVVQKVPSLKDGTLLIQTSDDDEFSADQVIVGIGVSPDVQLARSAGLAIQGGIVVDENCRTSDPDIFAAGDCTCFPVSGGVVHLENWQHALQHGAVAGRNAAGGGEVYRPVPSYWSEQYDLYIQGVGWPREHAQRVCRALPGNARLMLELRNGRIAHAIGINAQRELAVVRRLIERRIPVDPDALADPMRPLNAMLKVRV